MCHSLQGVGQQYIYSHDIHRQAGADAIAANFTGGFPDAAMIGQQGFCP